jgi:hypothetical protein
VEGFRSSTGATYPMLYGLTDAAKDAWEVSGYPSVRVVDAEGNVVGDSLDALRALL